MYKNCGECSVNSSRNNNYCKKMSETNNTFKPNTRPCYVSRVYGIVEFSDGVKRIDPIKIIFADE